MIAELPEDWSRAQRSGPRMGVQYATEFELVNL